MQRLVWWIQWHRRIGAVVAVLVIFLAVTGVLINHSQALGWHRAPVHSATLAKLYQIPLQDLEQGFALDSRWIVQRGEQVLLDRQPVAECSAGLTGAALYQDMIAVLCVDELLLLDPQGQPVETLRGLPQPGRALALQDNALWVRSDSAIFGFDDAAGVWQPVAPEHAPQWILPQPLPTPLKTALNADNPVPGLTRERVLLDLHSGRLFGTAGVWVVDAVGVLICLLAFSGLLTWVGRYYRRLRRRH